MAGAIYIAGDPGLGDHLLCNGIYREYARKYALCIIGVQARYESELKRMLSDIPNIQIAVYPDRFYYSFALAHAKIFSKQNEFEVLLLGRMGNSNLQEPDVRFDVNFYKQASLDFNLRWSNFQFPRNKPKEKELFDNLNCGGDEYIFLHQDTQRNFCIREQYLPKGTRIIEPLHSTKFNFFDYTLIIERATQVHCIESSFAALIESMPITVPKFAHRYARPEASSDPRLEFTYKSNWKVLY